MFSKVSWVYFTNKLFARGPRGESSRHAKRAFQKQGSFFSLSKTVMVLVFVFLFLPLIVVVAKSFNDNRGVEWTEFSLRWYRELLFNSETLWISITGLLEPGHTTPTPLEHLVTNNLKVLMMMVSSITPKKSCAWSERLTTNYGF